ncbi:RluA family pseudouridine synthase [Tenacibaculum sp. nBUS_03]|uniref:RluA family pseudouridine synthase n=1 Tax=Tenacibaculum sp. nBUS_03 TaxID=3395320 RepID=UPI003EB98D59
MVRKKYPKATGPLIVHRLDMSTSGILLIAKTKEVHKELQAQFINKTIKKRYVAIVNGILKNKKGTINLPLRVDLEDRPKQLVCYQHGKNALTHWETVHINNGMTLVYLYPITGRTHQLRVHMAHHLGLNTPIVGDDLYGLKKDRLYLHAESISFIHPITRNEMNLKVPAPFLDKKIKF